MPFHSIAAQYISCGLNRNSHKKYLACRYSADLDDIRRRRADQCLDEVSPRFERRLALGKVLEAVVDGGNAANFTRDVVQYAIDYVRRDVQLCHAGCRSAAQIVEDPRLDRI